MNNLTFTYPSSPLLTQLDDVNYKTLCNSVTLPEKCKDKEICECVHMEYVPLGATVELILIDQGKMRRHFTGYSEQNNALQEEKLSSIFSTFMVTASM